MYTDILGVLTPSSEPNRVVYHRDVLYQGNSSQMNDICLLSPLNRSLPFSFSFPPIFSCSFCILSIAPCEQPISKSLFNLFAPNLGLLSLCLKTSSSTSFPVL